MIQQIHSKTILSSTPTPDPWFGCRYTMNLYRGCQHQCIYCDSRSECYQIENFANILVKENAIELLEDELPRKRKKGTVGTGSMNDPYMPVERKYEMTRKGLEVVAKYQFPLHTITKSDLVLRDIDLIQQISNVYAAVSFTITTIDDELAVKLEPGAPSPAARLKAMKKLSDGGIYTGVTMMPVLPFIEDSEEQVVAALRAFAEHGAQYVLLSCGMTLRDRQREYYYQKLDGLFPGMSAKYRTQYGSSYSCESPNAKQLYEVANSECSRLGLPQKMKMYEEDQVKMRLD